MCEPVKMDYVSEYKMLQDTIREMQMLHDEEQSIHTEKVDCLVNDLIRYEREIELLKAKLSVVELIFGK